MQPLIGELQHEEFWIIYLNNSNKVLFKEQLSKGGLTGTLVDVRLVFKKAVDLFATAIVLCHNHPSGKLQPSAADKSITNKLKLAGETLDIKVLDHLIITENAYFSFADENFVIFELQIKYNLTIKRTKAMLLVYTHKITPRVNYIFKHFFVRILQIQVHFTTKVGEFVAHNGPKLSYSKAPLGSEFFIRSHDLLFEQGINDVDITVLKWEDVPCFFLLVK